MSKPSQEIARRIEDVLADPERGDGIVTWMIIVGSTAVGAITLGAGVVALANNWFGSIGGP